MSNHQLKSEDIIADSVEFAPGAVFTCKYDYYLRMRTDRYHNDPSYRARIDEKARVSFAGKQVAGVEDGGNNDRFAVAKRKKDSEGNDVGVEAREVSLSNKNGLEDDSGDTGNGSSGAPMVQTLAGGAVRVNLRSVNPSKAPERHEPEPTRKASKFNPFSRDKNNAGLPLIKIDK